MEEFWMAALLLSVGAVGGFVVGYHAGLARSAEAIYGALRSVHGNMEKEMARREAVIMECLDAVIATRKVAMHPSSPVMGGDWQRMGGIVAGIDKAAEAVRSLLSNRNAARIAGGGGGGGG